jgi:hypothetical protein
MNLTYLRVQRRGDVTVFAHVAPGVEGEDLYFGHEVVHDASEEPLVYLACVLRAQITIFLLARLMSTLVDDVI